MFDSVIVENRKPRKWAWFAGGSAAYLFILLNVALFFGEGHLSRRMATVLAPGMMLTINPNVEPFLGFIGGILIIIATTIIFGFFGLALRRGLQLFEIL